MKEQLLFIAPRNVVAIPQQASDQTHKRQMILPRPTRIEYLLLVRLIAVKKKLWLQTITNIY
jgi:hypothetical protein